MTQPGQEAAASEPRRTVWRVDHEDLYKVLQVDPDAESEVIDGAYRRLARKYHPDVNASPEASGRMQRIAAAHQVLSDPERRAEYDRVRRARRPAPVPKSSPRTPGRKTGKAGVQKGGLRVSILGGLLDVGARFGTVSGDDDQRRAGGRGRDV